VLVSLLVCYAAAQMVAPVPMPTAVDPTACHPQCRWQCDDPVCPAVCHPVCARPKCEMQCQQLECPKCTVHCEQPECSVRCPKEMCEKDSCPKCETVCAPAECKTSCVAPTANCAPLCEETNCQWSCAKPTTCPRPKCELQCEKPKCDVADTPAGGCCPCTPQAVQTAMSVAPAPVGVKMTFVEVMQHLRHAEQNGQAPQCCPCPGMPMAMPSL